MRPRPVDRKRLALLKPERLRLEEYTPVESHHLAEDRQAEHTEVRSCIDFDSKRSPLRTIQKMKDKWCALLRTPKKWTWQRGKVLARSKHWIKSPRCRCTLDEGQENRATVRNSQYRFTMRHCKKIRTINQECGEVSSMIATLAVKPWRQFRSPIGPISP